jgi:threonine/homoserine/homoserine lactone efflux protein
LVLSGPLFQVLSWGGVGWLVWLLLAAGLATGLWMQKKAASEGSGQGQEATPS